MEVGITGLPGSGKTTIFNALTGQEAKINDYAPGIASQNIGIVNVPDARIDNLSSIFEPKKTIYATVKYVDIGGISGDDTPKELSDVFLNAIRPTDCLLEVIRNFEHPVLGAPDPEKDLKYLDGELIFNDLVVVERRLERIENDKKRGKKPDTEEEAVLKVCHKLLSDELPIRSEPEIAANPKLRGYTFLSAKPRLVVVNYEEGEEIKDILGLSGHLEKELSLYGKTEMELGQLSPEEALEFRKDMGLDERSAPDLLVKGSYSLLGLISFFTTGKDEVRAWTIRRGDTAYIAANAIHSDIQKGFIRAELISYNDFIAAGTMAEAQKKGRLRLEGKEYKVEDGDIINFRFNV